MPRMVAGLAGKVGIVRPSPLDYDANMNVDRILKTFNGHGVEYLLIGGMNFLLRHTPVVTFDLDLWINDTTENLRRCERALAALKAEWGKTEDEWEPVARRRAGWLESQGVFCLTCPYGAIDIFRRVSGLGDWPASRATAVTARTGTGVPYLGLSDEDMLRSQQAVPDSEKRRERMRVLKNALGKNERRTD